MDSFEVTGRGAIKRFIELAHSGPYDMLLDVAAAWDEMAQDFDAGVEYTLQDFVDAGRWAAEDVRVTLSMILEMAEIIEKSQDKGRPKHRISQILQSVAGIPPNVAGVLASNAVRVAEEVGRELERGIDAGQD